MWDVGIPSKYLKIVKVGSWLKLWHAQFYLICQVKSGDPAPPPRSADVGGSIIPLSVSTSKLGYNFATH